MSESTISPTSHRVSPGPFVHDMSSSILKPNRMDKEKIGNSARLRTLDAFFNPMELLPDNGGVHAVYEIAP